LKYSCVTLKLTRKDERMIAKFIRHHLCLYITTLVVGRDDPNLIQFKSHSGFDVKDESIQVKL